MTLAIGGMPLPLYIALYCGRSQNDDGQPQSPPPPQFVGGVQVGTAGAVGSIYEGYTLSWGDEFDTMDIISPTNARGRWFTTRNYSNNTGMRGSDSLLSNMYDTDPYHTGHNDYNRGVPMGYTNMSHAGSVVSLQARLATEAEKASMSNRRAEVAAMLSGNGACIFYAGTNGSEDIIVDYRVRHGTSNPSGWHPDLWTNTFNGPVGSATNDNNQMNFEGNNTGSFIYVNDWNGAPTGTFTSTEYVTVAYNHDTSFHTITFKLSQSTLVISKDGVFAQTVNATANRASKPQFPLLTSHVYSATFNGDSGYDGAGWAADANGATLEVDWVRVWRRTGKVHYAPVNDLADQNVTYGQSTVIQLPSAATIWGTTPTNEALIAVPCEENEPGITHSSGYDTFPTGVSYNSGTRQLTVNIGSGSKTGRIMFLLGAWEAGGTCVPARFAVNVSPVITLTDFGVLEGVVDLDLYTYFDCGILTPKTVTVTGLGASGLSWNESTFHLTASAAVVGTYANVVFTCTNYVGQVTQATITITVNSGLDYTAWNGPGWFDFSDVNTITKDGASPPNITAIANKRSGGGDLTYGGTAGDLDYITNITGTLGHSGARLTRDVSGGASTTRPRLFAPTASLLSAMCRGNDRPYTVIAVFKPTDTNTGYIWAWSDTIDTTDSQIIALVRRSGSASSVRRQLVTATPNDVSWGSGFASGTKRVVAVKFDGTNVTVWDNSATTKSVNAVSQDTTTFNDELNFTLFAAETLGASDPLFQAVQCAMDTYEIVIESAAVADSFVQQAITDLAAKWEITLS